MTPITLVTFREALRYWLKLGFISFGGPAGQIAMMHQELVERRRWISERRFLHALNYCMVLPGPEAQQLATYIGWLMHGAKGGIAAGALFVLPSLVLLLVLSWVYLAYGHLPIVAAVLYGVKPAVTAIVLAAAWRIGSRTLRNPALWAIAIGAFVAIYFLALPFPLIILAAGVIGHVGGRIAPAWFSTGGAHGGTAKGGEPAIIDDATPPPPWARFDRARTIRLAAIGLAIWGVAMAIASLHAELARMGWFFTKAALLTFGGAYAVLPYVFQGGVEQFGWLTAAQMMDGLALGETTPGPLIMIVTFVGFVGGWTKALFGPEALALAAVAGGVVATFFTFLPSFLFILVGAPVIESTHGELRFTAPLTGITAAVVGVIVNLAVFFAAHVLVNDWVAVVIALAAFIALVRFKAGVITVIGACALAGLALRLF